tara:strand:- start:33390 stop:33731 length:342 start_codon:yes stop_codon:yes gene_type:complete
MPVSDSARDKQYDKLIEQRALRLASRGRHAVWLHLLFPLTLFFGFSLFFLLPLIAANLTTPPVSVIIHAYLDWCVPVMIVANLFIYYRVRNRLLAPYLEQVIQQQNAREARRT